MDEPEAESFPLMAVKSIHAAMKILRVIRSWKCLLTTERY